MTCPRSVYPWDIVVQKLSTGALFFDKRDASQFDYLTVHETSSNPPTPARDTTNEMELMNSPERLSLEATMINQNFTQQILRSSKFRTNFDLPNPFWDEEDNDGMEPASVAYRYRKFDLGDGMTLVARTELHGLAKDRQKADTTKIITNISANKKKTKGKASNPLDVPEGDQYMTAYALNEYDPSSSGGGGSTSLLSRPGGGSGISWREKIDSQAGSVLASELKNNSFKLAKWTAQSILAGAAQMKIGFVSRTSPKNAYDHVVLATQTYKPADFAAQITLNQGTMWGIMRMFIKLFADQPEGKYVIMRDPNRAIVRIFGVPVGTFEEESEGDGEDDSDDEEEEEGDEDEEKEKEDGGDDGAEGKGDEVEG
jgi:translation initiation factor 3 subunit D